jgi:hypothetical protein
VTVSVIWARRGAGGAARASRTTAKYGRTNELLTGE